MAILATLKTAAVADDSVGDAVAGWHTVPVAPEMPADGTPYVKSVGYYADWRRTRSLTEPVAPGTTIYTHIVFSEAMDYVAADTTKARPILYYRIAGELTRYRITAFGATGEDFLSGDCKWTMRAGDWGTFSVKVGAASADAAGVPLGVVYVHTPALLLGEASMTLSGARVEENQPVGTVIGRLSHISAMSPMYRIPDAEAATLFSIDASGYLRTQVVLNHEVRSFYEVEIEETETQTRESFGIWVLDVNEPPTGLRLTRDTFYREDGVGTEIGEVRVVDEDGSKDTYQFEVVSGSAYVGVNGSVLVVLKVFEPSRQEIVIEVRDSGGLRYRETFTITMGSKPVPVAASAPSSDASEEPVSTPDSDASEEPTSPPEPANEGEDPFGGGPDN